jgi:hypothetical protein
MDKNIFFLFGFIVLSIFLLISYVPLNNIGNMTNTNLRVNKPTKINTNINHMVNKINKLNEPFYNPRYINKFDFAEPFIKESIVSNYFTSLEFPENTSYELQQITSDYVTDKYQADTIGELYDTVNKDIFKVYKNNTYMI